MAQINSGKSTDKTLATTMDARTSVHVYRVKYGEARQIARVLTEMFTGGSSSSLLDNADSQIAPGSGTYATSSSDRLSLSNNASSSTSSNGFGSRMPSGTNAGGTTGFGTQTAAAAPGANTSDA